MSSSQRKGSLSLIARRLHARKLQGMARAPASTRLLLTASPLLSASGYAGCWIVTRRRIRIAGGRRTHTDMIKRRQVRVRRVNILVNVDILAVIQLIRRRRIGGAVDELLIDLGYLRGIWPRIRAGRREVPAIRIPRLIRYRLRKLGRKVLQLHRVHPACAVLHRDLTLQNTVRRRRGRRRVLRSLWNDKSRVGVGLVTRVELRYGAAAA